MGSRILVVNDTQEILDMFRDLLEGEGYHVVLYSYAITDMAEVEQVHPDLILLDYVFGGEKLGWQMLQKLKMSHKTETIPVVVCTAAIREVRDIEGYLKSQGIELVAKPFNIEDLLASVKRALASTVYDAHLVNKHEEQCDANLARAHPATQ